TPRKASSRRWSAWPREKRARIPEAVPYNDGKPHRPGAAPMTIPRIVLTGGPCAGKTSALSRLRARLQTYGRRVYTTSEASTLLLDGGAFVVGTSPQVQQTYQKGVLEITLALEGALLAFARGLGDKAVLVCDRGAMDGKAYVDASLWDDLLGRLGHDEA